MQIDGRGAVIVGGASGMARASAELLRAHGASIAILDLPTSAGEEVATGLGGSFHPVDVTDEAAVETALADAVPMAGSMAVAKTPVSRVSLWKNEGKKRWRESFRGGLKRSDTLYDSKPKLTGFPLCLTLKI